MSFTPEIFRKKLDNLQETQDSIVSISQWVLFHHRHAPQLCELWAHYALNNASAAPSKKKLSLLYLCNDVVQQARHKRKPEFASGFAAVLPRVLHAAYKAADAPIRPKIARLVSVWSERSIFAANQIAAMQSALESSAAGTDLPAAAAPPSPSSPVAPEVAALNALYGRLRGLADAATSNMAQVAAQAKSYLPADPAAQDNLPSPRVWASKLNVLEKLCHMTTQNLADASAVRKDILAALEALTKAAAAGVDADAEKAAAVAGKLSTLEATRADLQEMLRDEPEEPSPAVEEPSPAFEEPSPAFETRPQAPVMPEKPHVSSFAKTHSEPIAAAADDDDAVPTYEDSSDSDDEPAPPAKRALAADASSSATKKVAFSENIEVKEYERDDHTEPIIIAPDGDAPVDDSPDEDPGNLQEFSTHHKDDVQLLHEHTEDDYDPSSLGGEDSKSGLMDLLSKLS